MNNSRDLYNFAGDTAFDDAADQRPTYEANKNFEAKLVNETLDRENFQRQDKTPSVAPNRHQNEAGLSQNGRPIIIEYNNIFINSASQRCPTRAEAVDQSDFLKNGRDSHISSPYNAQRDNSNLPYSTEQIYPNCTPDIKYGAKAPGTARDYNDFQRAQEQFCNPDYIHRSSFPSHPLYVEHPNYPVQPNYSSFQNYPAVSNYTDYPVISNGIYSSCPPPYIPMANRGKIDQIARAIKEMGPLAFEITELSTGRRDFRRFPSAYGYRSNYYGCLNNFADTVPIAPFGFPLSRY